MFFERLPQFIGNHIFLFAAFVVLILMLIGSEIGRFTRRFKMISPAELVRLINRDNALVIDVSTAAEFEKGHRHLGAAVNFCSRVTSEIRPMQAQVMAKAITASAAGS